VTRILRALAGLALAASLAALSAPDTLVGRAAGGQPLGETDYGGETTAYTVGDEALDALQSQLRPTLEANRKELVGRTGEVKGFGAGTLYPQIWLRDSATLIAATRYFYPREYLTSWIEEHLAHQRVNGELYDWIAAGDPSQFTASAPRAEQIYRVGRVLLSADKNTTAADQETSAVHAAAQVFALTGDREWLAKEIEGRPLVERLDAALGYVLANRFSTAYGLVTSAFTADWGDVSPAYSDQRVIYLDERTPVVVGLYANAFFAQAAEELGEMWTALHESARASYWSEQATRIRTSLNRFLWEESRGFYRLHRLLPGPAEAVTYDDADTFALGGNALAVLYGIADPGQAERIFAAAEERRRHLRVSTIAGVLLPPYPRGFFPHPIQREEYTYQNGGQWDWWAGRFLLARFERGQAGPALADLREIAKRVRASGGLYEWYTREGKGQGSAHYAGSAGALASAVFQGLFGLDSRAAGLGITVRLGAESGAVRAYEPILNRYVVYRYDYDPQSGWAHLRFASNAPGTGRLELRLPEGGTAVRVLRDGQTFSFEPRIVGHDRYISLTTDWRTHNLEVQLR
jgi:hypothetical protein